MKTVVVLQSNYIPWKGYFDLVHEADVFVFYDDLQFTKNDWRNRNKIKTPSGAEWITIPVGHDTNRLICEVELRDSSWQAKHWKTIKQHYGKCAHFGDYQGFFEEAYLGRVWSNLSELNHYLIRSIAHDFLGVKTEFRDSREFSLQGVKQDRLLDVLAHVGATKYVSGPAARDYIEPERFADAGIELVWMNYDGYPEYPQRFPPFVHGVSILDLLFNAGPAAPRYIWGWRHDKSQDGK
jgi:hypothetical protein